MVRAPTIGEGAQLRRPVLFGEEPQRGIAKLLVVVEKDPHRRAHITCRGCVPLVTDARYRALDADGEQALFVTEMTDHCRE
jgi:hypothetical protein